MAERTSIAILTGLSKSSLETHKLTHESDDHIGPHKMSQEEICQALEDSNMSPRLPKKDDRIGEAVISREPFATLSMNSSESGNMK